MGYPCACLKTSRVHSQLLILAATFCFWVQAYKNIDFYDCSFSYLFYPTNFTWKYLAWPHPLTVATACLSDLWVTTSPRYSGDFPETLWWQPNFWRFWVRLSLLFCKETWNMFKDEFSLQYQESLNRYKKTVINGGADGYRPPNTSFYFFSPPPGVTSTGISGGSKRCQY